MGNKISIRNPFSDDGKWVVGTLVAGPHLVQFESVTGDILKEKRSTVRLQQSGQIVDVPSHLVYPEE